MGFTIHGYFGGSNALDAAADQKAAQRVRWGIRARAQADGDYFAPECGGFDTKATNRNAASAGVEQLSAAAAAVTAANDLRAESPGGFTAPGAWRSQSAYDLAPLILQPTDG